MLMAQCVHAEVGFVCVCVCVYVCTCVCMYVCTRDDMAVRCCVLQVLMAICVLVQRWSCFGDGLLMKLMCWLVCVECI